MSFYARHILPSLVEIAMRQRPLEKYRREVVRVSC